MTAAPAAAKPLHYLLDPSQSEVGFSVDVGQSPLKGRMPVASADLILDFDKAAASRIRVTLSPGGAQMGLPFATGAMKSPEVLDTARFPAISFESIRVRPTDSGAEVEGRITIRDVTRPITLQARLFRPEGSAEGTREALTVKLSGAVNRSEFGATGFADMVGDRVELNISARILLQN
ncbi:YceI family protein [Frigidibacter sp. RF13]|nr:YceI family protein [Frigidibacter sp. RF13]